MMAFDYDLFVIGGGSGGVRAARVAGQTGAKVALAEEDRYGGTCVIRGCVPKKLMVFASEFSNAPAEAQAYGWDMSLGAFSWSRFSRTLNEELDRLEGIYRKLLKGSKVDTFDARARLKDAHTVELSTGESFTAKHILIATGGRPTRPDLPNAEFGMVSDDLFHMQELPKSILIIGGGYIACEFACILNGLGVKVTQFYRGTQILRGFDEEARNLIAESIKDNGVDLRLETNIEDMNSPKNGEPFKVKATDGIQYTFDAVLFATGRDPNSNDLGLEAAGIATGNKGEIVVDAYSQTSIPSVYAIGDVTERVTLTPVAIKEGMAFVETVFKGNPTAMDYDLIPSAVFTQPEFGTVGLSEEDAKAKESIEVYATTFKPMRTSFAGVQNRVLMKLIVSQETRKVLGCHIVAPGAGEMIQMAGIAIKMGATKEDFDRTVAVHPSMAEEMVTMREPTRSA